MEPVEQMDVHFCVEALEEALSLYGEPEIFNTDQGTQFTSQQFTGVLEEAGVKISMDSRGRFLDNIFIERLWRSVKYDEVYLKAYEDGRQAQKSLGEYIRFYNSQRPHMGLNRRKPDEVYFSASRGPQAS